MEAKTKKIIIVGTISVVSLAILILGTKAIVNKVKQSKADKDKGENLNAPYNPDKQYKVVVLGPSGYVNVRSSPMVPEQLDYYDLAYMPWKFFTTEDNLLKKVKTSPVGNVISEKKGADGFLWYEIKLIKPIDKATKGWVREDAVKIQIKNK